MSADADQMVVRLKNQSFDRFVTLCKMHLSFLLDLPGSSLEELLGCSSSSSSEGASSSDRLWGFGNFTRKKSIKELSKSIDDEPVFGAPLSMSVIERILPLIRFLEMDENVNQEGLFRKCGHLGRQKTLREKVSLGNDLDLKTGVFTAHDCANVLKLFLGEMQDPLLTERHYFAHCQVAEMRNEEKKLQTLQLLIHLLPDENFRLLQAVLHLLRSVACSKHSLMTPDTLGTLFAPHLLVPKKVCPSDLHRRNQTITRVVAFMIENAPLLFRLPEAVVRDIRSCLQEVEMRDRPRLGCFSGSDLRTEHRVSCPDVVGVRADNCEIRTSISFADRTASLQAAAETDTVRALGELYAHIANLPESSKKRKLLKQFNQASAVGTTPVDSVQKPRRTKSLTQSLKKLVGHTKKTSGDSAPADLTSTDIRRASSPAAAAEPTTIKQFHTPVIKQHTSRTNATVQQPPLARLLKFDRQQPLSILPSSLKVNDKSGRNEYPFVVYHPRGGSTVRGHSWTNLTRRSSENIDHQLPIDSSVRQGSFPGFTAYSEMLFTPGRLLEESTADFVSPVRSSPPLRMAPGSAKKSLPFKKSS